MNSVSVPGRFIAFGVLLAAVMCVGVMVPTHVSAQTVSVETQQLLPPGQNSCQIISVTDAEPHVYGGEIESFDITISDVSKAYVGVLAQVGSTPIPLNYITRWAGTPSGLRIHVDTPAISIGSGVPVNLVLLASLPGQPTCITNVSFRVTSSGSTYPYTTPTVPHSSQGGPPTTSQSAPASGGGGVQATEPSASMASGAGAAASTTGPAATVAPENAPSANAVCAGGNAYRLWFILLAIYVVIVAIVVFAEPQFLKDSVLASTASVLLPLILLLLFWYLSEACRAASWIPVLACVIAIAGLFLAFREYETVPLLAAPSTDNK